MDKVVSFKQEIRRLEDQKWDILLTRGQRAASELWKPLDAKLKKLYAWWAKEAYDSGRERELPVHLRRRQ